MKCPYKVPGQPECASIWKYITLFLLPGKQVVWCSHQCFLRTGFCRAHWVEMAKQRISQVIKLRLTDGRHTDWWYITCRKTITKAKEVHEDSTPSHYIHFQTHTTTTTHSDSSGPFLCCKCSQPPLKCVAAQHNARGRLHRTVLKLLMPPQKLPETWALLE